MSLNAHDREALSQIEEALSAADPKLAAKLSGFSRLTDGEAMPERERITGLRRQRAIMRAVRGLCPGRPGQHGRTYWIPVTVWLVVSLVLFSVALILSHTGAARAACKEPQPLVCATRAVPEGTQVPQGHGGGALHLRP